MSVPQPSPFARLSAIPLRPPSLLLLWTVGALLLTCLYWVVFYNFWPNVTPFVAALMAVSNVAPLAVLAALTRAVLKTYVMPQGVAVQYLAHIVLAPSFAVTWYWAVLLLQALGAATHNGGIRIYSFPPVAQVWQAFQGLVLYALVAAICYAVRGGREASPVSFVEAAPPLERYLIRTDDEFVPVQVANIVSIVGAQDYSEVTTSAGKCHLVRMSLGEFQQRLDPHRFVRVHRSSIINLDHLERLEPAGNGRMIAHLASGPQIEVSRSGAQLLRSFVV
ncbi:two-component system LytT family response regulator [Sphingomonas sp. SORGH_AS 879]|nr:two-component system LytT family response regulator [Sphingomonas sp. SORGH_AS_0879]